MPRKKPPPTTPSGKPRRTVKNGQRGPSKQREVRHKTAASTNPDVEFQNDEGKHRVVIAAMAKHGFPGAGADALGITRATIRKARKQNPAFNKAMNEAYDQYRETLIKESHRRAVTGVLKPIFYKGEKVGAVREYSDRLLELNLKRHDTAYQEHVKVDSTNRTTVKNESGVLDTFDLTKLTIDELELFQRLMKKAERDNLAASEEPDEEFADE